MKVCLCVRMHAEGVFVCACALESVCLCVHMYMHVFSL